MAVKTAVSACVAVFAVLLQTVLAWRAGTARIHHTAHAHQIAYLKFLGVVANFGNASDDFVSDYNRISVGKAPVVTSGVQIAMAHATIHDVNQHIIGTQFTAFKTVWASGVVGLNAA